MIFLPQPDSSAGWRRGGAGQFWGPVLRLCASPTLSDRLPEVDTDGKLP